REEAGLRFDLVRGPLLRAKLLRFDRDEHLLLIVVHHVASDGWSLGVMARELTQSYEAFREGGPSPLPSLAIQYADFAVWQRKWLQEEALTDQLNYWKHQLAALQPLELPTDRPRLPVATHKGASETFILGTESVGRIAELSRREGVTVFMTMLAGFQLLLARYPGQEDIQVGVPIADRRRE